jgi:hypothetical protein
MICFKSRYAPPTFLEHAIATRVDHIIAGVRRSVDPLQSRQGEDGGGPRAGE